MRRIIIILPLAVAFFSCNNNKLPSGILPPEKMQLVLWDVIRADAFTTYFVKKDTAVNAVEENARLQKEIFALHKVSKESFYKSYDYYKSNTSLFSSLLDSMISKANRDRYKAPVTKPVHPNKNE